ncbi:glucans biosynthesis protein [Tepidamorphus gemmatus]|uniref:Glucans biosynthesis protein n=1 Tax=Tepidamorphus gemmatus TaxID=747076 RepID=A0A4V2UYY6_9HYPH|nr:glucan biosynthesis protein D [Tepidamorphus gemmatus]TCT09198.1 glucans biosynthesis protein [Tepidamorphus gemmatus]
MPEVSRRQLLAAAAGAGAFWTLPGLAARAAGEGLQLGPPSPFSFDLLKERARTLAGQAYRAPEIRAADILEAIDYDAHQQLRFRDEATLWGDDAARPGVRFFHLGRFFKAPVGMHVVENGQARPILYHAAYFDMPDDHVARALPDDIGFAGFRVMGEGNRTDWLAVLGASYFRTSGPFNQYGLSARGLAVDTATSHPEEFPRFTDFWLEGAGNGGLIVHALLDSPSVTGAYRIVSQAPAGGIVQNVDAALFVRRPIERLGIAPLTSMFWYGENNREAARDWRPEIHDSDGLEIWTGTGERIWRPLVNPPQVMVNAFLDNNPRGFGLMQRDRAFANYEDDGVFYDRRASVWVEPLGDWGEGSVQLVEIPTDDEIHDNIVAFWVPREPVEAGAEYDLAYRLHWLADSPHPSPVARVVATRIGMGGVPGQPRPPGVRKFAVDFDGKGMAGLDRSSGVEAVVAASRGTVSGAVAYPVVSTERWRVIFDLEIAGPGPVDLRMFLRKGADALSETWIYQYFPNEMS